MVTAEMQHAYQPTDVELEKWQNIKNRLQPNVNGTHDYNFDRGHTKDRLGSDAFGFEYEACMKDAELRDDIISYLAEYRFQLPTYEYTLHFSEDRSGAKHIRDKYRGEPMRVKAQRSIEERKARGLPTHRAEAELQGMIRLEDQLRFAQDGDKIYWASPPGPKEEGYGQYGFLYEGTVRTRENGKLELSMVAIRLEKPTIGQYNRALSLLTGRTMDFSHADSFLEQPFVVRASSIDAKKVLKDLFFFEDLEEKRQEFYKLIEKLGSTIDEVIQVLKTETKAEKLKAFYTLENFALHLKEHGVDKGYEHVVYAKNSEPERGPSLADLSRVYGHESPQVAGSCGSTKKNVLQNNGLTTITTGFEALRKALFGEEDDEEQEWFTCPNKKCGFKATGPIGDKCPGCGLTKEQYAKDGGEVC